MVLDGYIRVSQVNGRSGDRFISPQVQRDQIQGYARLHGHQLGVIFEELDQSGGRADRPLLLQAIARQEAGEAQVLCVAKLDRFGRSLVQSLAAIERINKGGGAVVSVADELNTDSPTGRLVLRLMLSLAEWELDRVRLNWAEAQQRAIARGAFISSWVPLGYKRSTSGRLVVDDRTAPLVRELFARRLDGERPEALARWLSGQGVPTPSGGKRWDGSPVRTLIKRRAYLGEVSHGEYVNRCAHPPLVDAATWQAAQLPPESGPGPRQNHPALLKGLLRCAGCGRVLSTRRTDTQHTTYVCQGVSSAGVCSSRPSIADSQIEPYAEAVMWGLVKGGSAHRQQAAIAHAQRQAGQAKQQLADYRDRPSLMEALGAAKFEAGLVKRRVHEEKTLEALAAARRSAQAVGPGPAQLRTAWPHMNLDEKREVIASVLDCLFVSTRTSTDRIWAVPRGGQPPGLPVQAPRRMPGIVPFDPGPAQARVFPTPRTLDWSEAKVTHRLRSFVESRQEWPAFMDFQAAGLGLLHANALRLRSIRHWAKCFAVSPPVTHRPMPSWSEGRVREELVAALVGWKRWPTHAEWSEMGLRELRKAAGLHHGAHRWAEEMGLVMGPRQQQNRLRWTVPAMEDAVRELAAHQDHFPDNKQFKAAGLNGLYASIAKAGIRPQLAKKLGLDLPHAERYRRPTRWTDAAIQQALDPFLADRDHYPTQRAYEQAGLAGLFQKLGSTPGGHDAVAERYGLERRGSGHGLTARRRTTVPTDRPA